MDHLILSKIMVYPVKGLPGVELKSAYCEQRGFTHDRRWVITDANGRFISQREHASLTQFSVYIENDAYEIAYGNDIIGLPFALTNGNRSIISVWDDEVAALEAPADINEWFSRYLGQECRLYYMDDAAKRPADPRYAQHNEEVSFADGFPYLIIGEASLEQLNSKLNEKLPMDRFRPNLVFSGGYPHQEDDLKAFNIGEVSFYGVKLCSRCIVTTIDQNTGRKGKEPLKALATYRKFDNKIKFGMNVLAKNEGTIQVGDQLEIDS